MGRFGGVQSILCRRRVVVSDGEVEVSETVRHKPIIEMAEKALNAVPWQVGFQGPITLQFIDNADLGSVILEINPRFGGGVTHSIHLGHDMPRWILRERYVRELEPAPGWPDRSLMTRARRDVFFDPPSA